jgi:hypothetical protein
MGIRGSIPEMKRRECKADLSLPSGADVKNGEAVHPLTIQLHGVVLNIYNYTPRHLLHAGLLLG